MGVLDSLLRKSAPEADHPPHRGYYATHDALDYDDWDDRLDRVDYALDAEEKRRRRWWQRDYWLGRRKRWWASHILAAIIGLFILLATSLVPPF